MRILSIYSRLIKGDGITKRQAASLFNVTEKTIQRDLEDLRNYFIIDGDELDNAKLVYNRSKHQYLISRGEH
ncbi:MAG: hypothetical protein ACRDDY_17775 [Clostridium sp.]|uniref:hypothetical protein n=1 Tax=Clostridium sp. TaxID=1506 RepID=UPI003EE728AA